MVALTEYEKRGDLTAPFTLGEKEEREQRERARTRDAVTSPVPKLAWEEYLSGAPWPGCGLPYRDAEPWEFRGTQNFTDDERARYDAEQERYRAAHGDRHAIRHGVSGSLTTHCGRCCPPPPLSPTRIKNVRRILDTPRQPHELMRWRLRLYCGHIVERSAHASHRTLHAAFTGGAACPECGLDPATIVDGEAIGLVEEPPVKAKTVVRAPSKPTRA